MQQILHIEIGSQNVTLRPSLHAAGHLVADGDVQSIFRAVAGVSLGAIADLIHAAQHPPNALSKSYIADLLLTDGIAKLSDTATALIEFMAGFVVIDGDEHDDEFEPEAIPFKDYLSMLFDMGSGFIGWTPSETWSATPTEITQAAKKRMEFWGSLFGGSDKKDKPSKYDETRDLDGLEDLRIMGNARR